MSFRSHSNPPVADVPENVPGLAGRIGTLSDLQVQFGDCGIRMQYKDLNSTFPVVSRSHSEITACLTQVYPRAALCGDSAQIRCPLCRGRVATCAWAPFVDRPVYDKDPVPFVSGKVERGPGSLSPSFRGPARTLGSDTLH